MLTKFNKLVARRRQLRAENLARAARHARSLHRRASLLKKLEFMIDVHKTIDLQPLHKNWHQATRIHGWQTRQQQHLITAEQLAIRAGAMHP